MYGSLKTMIFNDRINLVKIKKNDSDRNMSNPKADANVSIPSAVSTIVEGIDGIADFPLDLAKSFLQEVHDNKKGVRIKYARDL